MPCGSKSKGRGKGGRKSKGKGKGGKRKWTKR